MAESKQKRSGDHQRSPKRDEEFAQKMIDIARVTRVMAGGKRMSFRACVVIGDHRGHVGMGVRKGADVSMAINKAVNAARKHLITVQIVKDTIPAQALVKFGAAKILLKPAPIGTGIIAGGPVRAVLELSGIKNVVAKMLGSGNKINNVSATLEALKQLKTKEQVEKLRQ